MATGPSSEGHAPDDIEPMSAGTKVGIAVAGALGILFVVFLIVAAQHSTPSNAEAGSATTTTASSTTPTTVAGGTVVNVTVSDTKGLNAPMTIVADQTTVPAGKVTFVVKNTGTIDHEMVVLKLKPGETWNTLPIADAGDPPAPVQSGADKVSEDNNVAETGDPNLKPGESRSFNATLAAGNYALVCNIAKHYGLGMRAPLTVS